MKKITYFLLSLCSFVLLTACSDDDEQQAGNPVMQINSEFDSAHYGDSLPFTVQVSDEVPLSTLKARLYYGSEPVSEVVVRTKTVGTYSGKIYVPYFKDMPDGEAKLEFTLQNIHFTQSTQAYTLPVSRAVYPYLTLVTTGGEYRMMHVDGHRYELKATLPQKIKGYIRTPKASPNGNELTFGWEGESIEFGSTNPITFSNLTAGEYAITFNTLDYSAAPFIVAYVINGVELEKLNEGDSEERYKRDLTLKQGDEVRVEGIDDFAEWWIDPDFFAQDGDKLTFRPIDGRYRLIADIVRKYLKVEVLNGDTFAQLQPDGSGAIWIVGEGAGKPALKYAPSWNPDMSLCMAPMGNGKYVASFVAGDMIGATSINFVFIHQKAWGTGFKGNEAASGGNLPLEVVSDLIFIGKGQNVNGVDDGNLALIEGKTLTVGKTYVFELEVPDGLNGCKLTITEKP